MRVDSFRIGRRLIFMGGRYFKEDDICDIFSQLFLDYGTFKILSISPTQIPPSFGHPKDKYRHLELAAGGDEAAELRKLFSQLNPAIEWIHKILTAEADCKPRVVVHCKDEIRGHIVVCAYRERCLLFSSLSSAINWFNDFSDVLEGNFGTKIG